MDEEELMKVEIGMAKIISKLKQNLNSGDQERLEATLQAKLSLRKVILNVAIQGDLKDIEPIRNHRGVIGWKIIQKNGKISEIY